MDGSHEPPPPGAIDVPHDDEIDVEGPNEGAPGEAPADESGDAESD